MTLADVLPSVRQLRINDKLKLIRILAEELDADDTFVRLESERTYFVATPNAMAGAAQILMDALTQDLITNTDR